MEDRTMKTKRTYKAPLKVIGYSYNVREYYEDATGDPKLYGDAPEWWFEYRVTLIDANGAELSEWDSLTETYNGVQRLTQEDCQKAIQNIQDEVAAGKVADWFHNI
jgi:hypothetical protein